MKKFAKQGLSLLMALVMCLSILSGISFVAEAQTVDYVYAGNYIKNWGTRDTIATFLSPNAEAFYEDNNTSYEELAALSGSSSTSSVPSSALYQELKSLMTSNHSYQTSYDATRDLYQYTDCQNSGKVSTKISSFYSGKAIGPAWDSGATWNREHTWPNSKGLNGKDEDDIMMLRPTSKSENSSRGNKAYGESANYYDPNGLGMTLRGDVARIMLYQYIRWGNTSYMWGEDGVMESKTVLLKWMEEDPVDTWELGRNDSVESITGTRNVFVDYPELAFLLFNEEIPSDYTTPSGSASTSTYEITVVSSNTAYGTVTLNGKTITASPKAGYEAAGYTVVSGQADVTRNGNTFIVTAHSDVTIRINFQALARATVQYAEYGQITGSGAIYKGEALILPEPVNAPQDGHTFVGWVTEPVEDTETAPTLYAVGSRYTVTHNQVFYALYSRNESGGSGNSTQFEPYTGTLTAGDYIIVDKSSGEVAMKASVTSKNRLEYSDVTYTNGNILAPAADLIWHIEPSGSYWTIYNAAKGSYAAGTGTKNTATLKTAVNTYTQWIAARQSSGTFEFTNVAHKNAGINPLLRRNGTVGFACYATNTNVGAPLHLYKRAEGTVYYFTQIGEAACLHPDAHNVSTIYPECDSVGYTAGVYCPDCDEYLSGHEEIPAINHAQAYKEDGKAPTCTETGYEARLYCPDCDEYLEELVTLPAAGHSYNAVVTPPQVGIQGYTTYTCENCGDSYVADYTDALEPETALEITSQPESITANVGDTVTFTVAAEGQNLTYRWKFRNPGATAWSNTSLSGYNTDTLTVANLVGATHNGRQYKCVITDANGNSVETEPATLTVAYMINDAKSQGVQIGETAVFSVNYAAVKGIQYQWQYKGNTASAAWANTSASGNKTNTLSVVAKSTNNRYMYRCRMTVPGIEGYVYSKEVYLNVVEDPAAISANPSDASGVSGAYVNFSVAATGDGVSYQWQWSNDGVNWSNTKSKGYNTATVSVKTNNFMSGRMYRCVVKTYNGANWNRTYSEAATLTVLPAADILESLPETVTVKAGENAVLHIGADGEGLSYQWQWAKFKGNWKNTTMAGATTDTLTVPATADKNGRYYRVVITNSYGGYVETKAVQLIVK